MNILFINLPYYGHIVPTLGLVEELIKKGHHVTYLMPIEYKDIIQHTGASFIQYNNHKQLSKQIKNAYKKAESIINNYDLVIYEQFFFLGKHLADKYHKPVVRVFSAPIANRKLMDEYIQKGPLSIFRCKWIAKAFTKDIVKNVGVKAENWLDEIIYNPPALNLIYTLPMYQPYANEYDYKHYKFLGPSLYKRQSESFDFVKKDRPVIYISLGTIVKGSLSFYNQCIDAFRNENVDVIISANKQYNKIKNRPENIHIYNHVPQLDVLKAADVFITHGGMNSVSEAYITKTPMVIIPKGSDQYVNARCAKELGVARVLEYKKTNSQLVTYSHHFR